MRARDSIGVAKFKIDQKIRRESGDDLSRTSLENAVQESFSGNTQNLTGKTRELTGKSARQNTGRLTRDVTTKAENSNSNLSRLTEPSFRLPAQNRSEMITPDLESSQRPAGRKRFLIFESLLKITTLKFMYENNFQIYACIFWNHSKS